jgi:tetratricopeptide (TPR) repeat protein
MNNLSRTLEYMVFGIPCCWGPKRLLWFVVLFLPLFSGASMISAPQKDVLEGQADNYANRILPQILTNWNIEVFSENAHSSVWQRVTENELEAAFFVYRRLGGLQSYAPATGQVVISESKDGNCVVVGNYATHSFFENGEADVTLITMKDSDVWRCAGILVKSDAFYLQPNHPPVDEFTRLREMLAAKTDEERARVENELPEKDELAIRRRFTEISALAELRKEQGNLTRAAALYRIALRGLPSNLDVQMKLAEIQMSLGHTNEAIERASTVYRLAESPILFETAGKLLTALEACPGIPEVSEAGVATNVEFVLVPIGEVNQQLVLELRAELQRELGIPFVIWDRALPLPEPGRTEADQYVERFFSAITQEMTRLQYDDLLTTIGLDHVPTNCSHEQKKELVEAYIAKLGPQEAHTREQYNVISLQLSTQYQYHVQAMIDLLGKQFFTNSAARVKGYIGVTDADLFSEDSNFYFGSAEGDYGVISSSRFRAGEGFEPPSRPRLVKRLKKQAMSTVAAIMDIPRCADPSCARAFPNSVAEHDAKSEHYCPECLKRLEAFKCSPNSNFASSLHVARGYKLIMKKDYVDAIVEYQRAVQLCSTNIDNWLFLGNSLRLNRKDHESERVLLKAISLDPNNEGLYIELAITYSADKRLQDAIRLMDSFLQSNPSRVEARVERGRLALIDGDLALCQKLTEEAIALCPTNSAALTQLGIVQNNKGNYPAAIASATRAFSLKTNNELAVHVLGLSLANAGHYKEALPYLERAVDMNTNDAVLWRHLGVSYSSNGQLDHAIPAFQKAISLDTTNASFISDLGYTYFLKGMNKAAIHCYDQAVRMDQGNGLAYYNRALAYHALGEYTKALENLNLARDKGYSGSPQFRAAVEKALARP